MMIRLGLLCGMALAVAACGPDPYLPKHTPQLSEQDSGVPVERGVDPAVAARIAAHFERDSTLGRPRGIYVVPGQADRHLVVGWNPRGTDYGLRFILLASENASVRELARSRGMMDSDWLDPVFFAEGECHFLLADAGSEGSWGVEAFRLCRDSLSPMGTIPVSALPVNTVHDPAENPLPFARMRRGTKEPVVEFTADLVHWVNPNGDGAMSDSLLRGRGGRPIAFRATSGGFQLVAESVSPTNDRTSPEESS